MDKENNILDEEMEKASAEEVSEEIQSDAEVLAETEAETETEVEAETEKDEQSELYEELEQVRELFEKTLKDEKERAERNDGELIQQLEDLEYHEEESPAEETKECEHCGNELPLSCFCEGRDYCETCREKMRRRPVRISGILTVAAMIIAFLASLYTSMTSVINITDPASVEYEYFFEGFDAYMEDEIVTAVNGYTKYLEARQGSGNISMTALKHTIDCYDRMGAYTYAAELIENYFTEKELKLPWNIKYKNIITKNEQYSLTYTAITDLIGANATEDGYDFDKLIEETLALKNETDDKGKAKYSHFIIDLYTFDFRTMTDCDNEELYSYIEEIDKQYGKKENSHLSTLCRYAALTGRTDVADKCFSRMMKLNSQNTDIYAACFNCYRFLETPDTDKMKEICDEMAEICTELSTECGVYNMDYLYNLAITYLLQGEGSMAMEAMEELYSYINYYGSYYSGSYTTSTVNLYALVALYNGDTETYEWAKSVMEGSGHQLSDLVEKYKDGEMTALQVLTDKGGDIA